MKQKGAYEQRKKMLSHPEEKKGHALSSRLFYLITTIAAVCCIIYICFAGYYWDKFLSGTYINGVEVSGMTIQEAEKKVKNSEINKITLNARNNEKNQIDLSELKAKVVVGDRVNKVKDKQNPLLWLSGCIGKENNDVQTTISYSSANLESYINALPVISGSDRIKPEDAKLVYDKNNGYEIKKEVLGNTVDKDKLMDAVVKAIRNHEGQVDLEKCDCYIKPKRTVTDADFKNLQAKLDKVKATKISYNDNGKTESADYSQLKDWINVDSNFNVTVKRDCVNNFVTKVAYKFNTLGKIRNFKTESGSTIRIGGGTYGNRIAYEKEFDQVKKAVLDGTEINRAPEYVQKSLNQGENDIGDTYVEVSISRQRLFFFQNGKKIIEAPVVTGKPTADRATPRGVCCILSKERNRWLKGPGYASYVRYWMQINGGVGIHDASWRKGQFGGSIYLGRGSHGCINTPFAQVVDICNRVQIGTPVIVY